MPLEDPLQKNGPSLHGRLRGMVLKQGLGLGCYRDPKENLPSEGFRVLGFRV